MYGEALPLEAKQGAPGWPASVLLLIETRVHHRSLLSRWSLSIRRPLTAFAQPDNRRTGDSGRGPDDACDVRVHTLLNHAATSA